MKDSSLNQNFVEMRTEKQKFVEYLHRQKPSNFIWNLIVKIIVKQDRPQKHTRIKMGYVRNTKLGEIKQFLIKLLAILSLKSLLIRAESQAH